MAAFAPVRLPKQLSDEISERAAREVKHLGVISVLLEHMGELVHIVLISITHIEAGYDLLRALASRLIIRK